MFSLRSAEVSSNADVYLTLKQCAFMKVGFVSSTVFFSYECKQPIVNCKCGNVKDMRFVTMLTNKRNSNGELGKTKDILLD